MNPLYTPQTENTKGLTYGFLVHFVVLYQLVTCKQFTDFTPKLCQSNLFKSSGQFYFSIVEICRSKAIHWIDLYSPKASFPYLKYIKGSTWLLILPWSGFMVKRKQPNQLACRWLLMSGKQKGYLKSPLPQAIISYSCVVLCFLPLSRKSSLPLRGLLHDTSHNSQRRERENHSHKAILERYHFAICPSPSSGISFVLCTDVQRGFRAKW